MSSWKDRLKVYLGLLTLPDALIITGVAISIPYLAGYVYLLTWQATWVGAILGLVATVLALCRKSWRKIARFGIYMLVFFIMDTLSN